MTWVDWESELQRYFEPLERQEFSLWTLAQHPEGAGTALHELDFAHRQELDPAIRAIANREPLPPLSNNARFLLWIRLDYAIHLLISLGLGAESEPRAIVPNPLDGVSPSEFLDWLLVRSWRCAAAPYIAGSLDELGPP